MIKVSEVYKTPPAETKTDLQRQVYETLEKLDIAYERVDNDPAVTMADCVEINKKLKCTVVKTLFMCNRQKTSFYLFVMPDGKPFVTKNFGAALGVSRVSFAPPELLLEKVGVEVGATTVFGLLLDKENEIRTVFDSEVLTDDKFGCTDGTTTGYMCVKLEDVLNKFLPFVNHKFEIIEV